MRRCLLRVSLALGVTAAIAVALGGSLAPAGAQAQPPPGTIPGQYIVVFHDGVADPPGLANALVGRPRGRPPAHLPARPHRFRRPLLRAGRRRPRPEPQRRFRGAGPGGARHPPRKYFQTLPEGVDRVDADQNATANIDGVNDPLDVDIAILDTGIDLDHPDLSVFYNQSFINGAATGDDDNYHGTHVAGTAAAIDNGIGVVGVAPGARLWALKVLNKNGSGSFADIIEAIDFVTGNGQIEVANMSLGGTGKLDSLRLAIQNSVAAGVVYVVAAGNSSRDVYGNDGTFNTSDDFIPAAYPEAAAISGMVDTDGRPGGLGPSTSRGADDTFYSSTNFSPSVVGGNPVTSPGKAIDIAAPGVEVLSTYPGGLYATISGTSMSSPHVAGAAALRIAAYGSAGNAGGVAAIRQALIDGAQPQSAWGPPNTKDPDAYPEGLLYLAGGPTNTPPNASFTHAASSPTLTFTDTSTDADGDVMLWAWDFGDGATSTTQHPTHTYESDGTYSVTLTVTDDGGATATASQEVDVTGANNPPLADPQAIATPEDTPVAITLTGSDPDADSHTFSVATGPTNGTLSGTAPNLTYTPDANFNGPDSFTFTANDALLTSDPATVSITVTAVNDRPLADDQSVTTVEYTQVTITLTASDVDGDALTFNVVSDPPNGSLTGTAPNLTYTPSLNFNGPDVFTFTAYDGSLTTAPATVSITVTANQPPTANAGPDQSASDVGGDGYESVTLDGSASSDPDGTIVSYEWTKGATVLGSTANVTYNFAVGPHTVTLTVTDNGGATASDTVVVTVTAPAANTSPTAAADSYSVKKDQTLTVAASGVLANDTDANGDPLTAVLTGGPANGTLTLNPDGTFTYTPNPGFTGKDSFTYTAFDGTAYSAPAKVTINVTKGGKGGNGDNGDSSFCDTHLTHRKCL